MNGLPLRLAPEAADDFDEASVWYDARVPGLGRDFANEIDKALQKLVLNPTLFPVVFSRKQARRIRVVRFPYRIFYTISSEEILVHAILHVSQDDWIIKRRLGS